MGSRFPEEKAATAAITLPVPSPRQQGAVALRQQLRCGFSLVLSNRGHHSSALGCGPEAPSRLPENGWRTVSRWDSQRGCDRPVCTAAVGAASGEQAALCHRQTPTMLQMSHTAVCSARRPPPERDSVAP